MRRYPSDFEYSSLFIQLLLFPANISWPNHKNQITQEDSVNLYTGNQVLCVYVHFRNNKNQKTTLVYMFSPFSPKVPLEDIHCCFPFFVLHAVVCPALICHDNKDF